MTLKYEEMASKFQGDCRFYHSYFEFNTALAKLLREVACEAMEAAAVICDTADGRAFPKQCAYYIRAEKDRI